MPALTAIMGRVEYGIGEAAYNKNANENVTFLCCLKHTGCFRTIAILKAAFELV